MRWPVVLPASFLEAESRAETLARRTSMRVGGRPAYLFEPEDAEQALDVVRLCRNLQANELPVSVTVCEAPRFAR